MSFAEGRWASLTRCLDEATHPVRVAIDGLLGGDVPGLQADYRTAHGPLLVAGSGGRPGHHRGRLRPGRAVPHRARPEPGDGAPRRRTLLRPGRRPMW